MKLKAILTKRWKRPPEWLSSFLIFFLVIVAYDALRRLHAAGQPILGTIVDAAGISALMAIFSMFWERPAE